MKNSNMIRNCILCGDSRAEKIYKCLKKCIKCNLISADLDLTEVAVRDLYQKRYFFGVDYVDYIKERNALRINFNARLYDILRYVDSPENKYLFEIGCAYGFFLEVAKKRFGYVRGIDITEEGCVYAQRELGLDVSCGDFLQCDIETNKYDIFCLWDTIEHLRELHLYIEKIGKCIKKGGIIFLSTGDIESWHARFSKEKWRMIHPPTHLFYFSHRTIVKLLEKYGFEIVKIKYCGNFRTINYMFLNHQESTLYNLVRNMPFLSTPIYLNLFDIMHVIARKA